MTDCSPLPPFDPALLALMLDRVPARVVVLDREHRYRWANALALVHLGLPAEQVIGATIAQVRGEDVFQRHLPVAERLFAGEEMRWEGWTHYPGLGRRYTEEWLLPFSAPGSPPGAPVQLVIGFARDLTELQQQAQQLSEQVQALQRAELLKAAIVDNAFAAIVTSDGAGRIVEFNAAAEAMFGLPRQQALGRPVAEVMVPPRHRTAHEQGMQRIAAGAAPRVPGQRLQMHALRADGSEFPIEMVLWQTRVGGQLYHTASVNDISERARAAAVIERQRDALRQSEKLTAMGSLLAGVAHELNNPLSIVMGRAGLLQDKAGSGPLADDARSIRDAADRCGRIVRSFLNMARSRPAQRSAVSLNELVIAAAEMLQYSLRTHGIVLTQQLAPQLPAVNADGDQIGQIVLNLIVNAQQALAGAPGVRQLTLSTGVETRRDSREPRVWLRVADNGPGVPAALQASIFEPFFTTKPEGLGTGLGLAVSRSLARDHGGDLLLEARPAGGCFRLSLPLSGEAAESSVPMPLAAPPAASAARLLVIDDEPEIAELMRHFLEAAGYEVATAESGAVALELLAAARFDAIVSDLRMPDMDGAALWRAVKARWPALARRMLFVTGDTLSHGADSFLSEAGCASLDKPFARADLIERVRRLLQA